MVTTDNAEMPRIIRDYYEQLYSSKISNLEEMDRFLEKLNLPRLNELGRNRNYEQHNYKS